MSASSGTNATTSEASSSSSSRFLEYLRALPPTWNTIQQGLAIFAAIVILRSFIRRISSWLRSPTRRSTAFASASASPPASAPGATLGADHHHGVRSHKSTTINHFRPFTQYPRPPIPWMQGPMFHMDDKFDHNIAMDSGDDLMTFDGDEDSPPANQQATAPGDRLGRHTGSGALRYLIARPPPAPPLTPPELSSSIYTMEGRPFSQDSFIHQPNPDYASASSSTPSSGSRPGTSTQARRFSYIKTIPIGVPIQHSPSIAVAAATAAAGKDADLKFSPSSYPPSSPLLPPAPPVVTDELGADLNEKGGRREIDLQGQVVSVLDEDGAGWKRHTRVYGGGVCLACKAAGREHGAGGFYGATVSPEEMR